MNEHLKTKKRKTVIGAKTRLLLEIATHGVNDTPDYLARLSRKIDYSAGSIKSTFIPDLLDAKFIESLNPDKTSPPYRVTAMGREILEPIFLVRTIGYWILVFAVVAISTLLFFYINNPQMLLQYWLPNTIGAFSVISLILILYPQIVLKLGKKSF